VYATKEIYIERIFVHRKFKSINSNDDALAFLLFIGLAVIYLIWKYAQYAESLHIYASKCILAVIAFAVTTAIISFVKWHIDYYDWSYYIIPPIFILISCAYLANLAYDTFDYKISELAQKTDFISFYMKDLTVYGRNFIFAHIIGYIFLCTVILFTSFAVLHYVSLMNQRSTGMMNSFWSVITRLTLFFSGRIWLFLMVVMVIMSYVSFSPNLLATWITKS